jgi:DNA-binding transcriptional MerR regulator
VGHSLDELAELSGVSRRTIRYYQAERLLPRPHRTGRDAVYGDDHVERLELIGELRDRGLSLQTIRQLVTTEHPAHTVSKWLGIGATLGTPWSADRPRRVDRDELVRIVDPSGTRPKGLIGELAEHGYVAVQPDGTWEIPSPALLDAALELLDAGVAIDISAQIRDLFRRRMAKAIDDTVELLVERSGAGFAGRGTPEEVATAMNALRPIAGETVSVILAHEVDRALADLARKGPRPRSRSRRH